MQGLSVHTCNKGAKMKTKSIGLIIVLVSILAITAGCGKESSKYKPVVFVSIQPQAYFAERIAEDAVEVQVLVGQGQSPHSFEPTPRQMAKLADAEIYFTIGVTFEKGFIDKIRDANPGLKIIRTDVGISKRVMKSGHHHEGEREEKADEHEHQEGSADPHIWLNPINAKKIIRTMCSALSEEFPEHKTTFESNTAALEKELDALDKEISRVLAPLKGKELFVFHPAFGYFTDRYGLVQEPVEIEGKEPSAKQLADIIQAAQEDNVKVIFVQPQFARTSALAIAKEIKGAVVPIDPLARDYINNLRNMASEVRKGIKE